MRSWYPHRCLDECYAIEKEPKLPNGNRPGDIFNFAADWDTILAQHGWQKSFEVGPRVYWTRPGKVKGVSATTGYCSSALGGDLLYVFSSNVAPFEDGKAYSKFAAKSLLDYDGDFKKCANALRSSRADTPMDSPEPLVDLESIKPVSFQVGMATLSKWLVDFDAEAFELVLGIVAANSLDADPVFLFLVGAPAAGKTELVRALYGHPATKHISTLTPASLISGFDGEGDPSLIPQLNGKTLVIKDFTPVLEMNREKRAEVFGILRDAYDGHCSKAFGNRQPKFYESKFNVIAAVTSAINQCVESMQTLGERFLRLNIIAGDSRKRTARSMQNSNHETEMRREMLHAALGMLKNAVTTPPTIGPAAEKPIVELAEFLAASRTAIPRDRQKEILNPPQLEGGTRVVKQLTRLAQGVAMFNRRTGITDHELRLIRRVVQDSIP